MKKEVIVCDICEREFSPCSNDWGKLKIRHYDWSNSDDFEYRRWKKLDLCQYCAEELIEFVKKKNVKKKGKK